MSSIGKIFVFAVFIMSLMLMTLAGAIYMSHVNWKDEIYRTDVRPGQQKGYIHQLKDAQDKRQQLESKIAELQIAVAESEQARDQVIAKLQTAIVEKNAELTKLRDEEQALRTRATQANAEVKRLTDDLANADRQVADLAEQVRQQQTKVDSQVEKSAKLSATLAQTQADLTMAEERKAQLQKQITNARRLLEQNGLTINSLPQDEQPPKLEGNVVAVAASSIQVSLGSDDGLQVGHALEIYRNGEYIGRAMVRSVTPDHAIAEMIKEYARGIVQRGDKVTTRLKA